MEKMRKMFLRRVRLHLRSNTKVSLIVILIFLVYKVTNKRLAVMIGNIENHEVSSWKNLALLQHSEPLQAGNTASKRDEFQRIPHTGIYVYSATRDNRLTIDTPNVTLITAIVPPPVQLKTYLHCRFRYSDIGWSPNTTLSDLRVLTVYKQKLYYYHQAFILCMPDRDVQPLEVTLSIFRTSIDDPLLTLKVKDTVQEPHQPKGLAHCVEALPRDRELRVDLLLEWFEYHYAMGVDKVIVYNTDRMVPPGVASVLEHYQSTNQLELINWKLPDDAAKNISNSAEILSLNDCLYRTMGTYRYVSMYDLDEVIVPLYNGTKKFKLLELYNKEFNNAKKPDHVCGLIFKRLQFCDVGHPDMTLISKHNLTSAFLHKRAFQSRLTKGPNPRSVYRPHLVDTVTISEGRPLTGAKTKGLVTKQISWKTGGLFYYNPDVPCNVSNLVENRAMLRYTNDVLYRAAKKKRMLAVS